MRYDSGPPPLGAPRQRRWGKKLTVAGVVMTLVIGVVGYGLYTYASNKIRGTNDKSIDLKAEDPGGPVNILVLGSDSREGLTPKEQGTLAYFPTGGSRSDTIILVHLFADRKHAVVLSFPRDLRVHVPGFGETKINAAYNLGPNNVIKTIQEYSGLTINHYVQVNFVGFRKIVDSLGGVPICVDHSYNDPNAGLFLAKAGCYHFSGDQALGYARTRHEDARGDFDRIDHQQRLIRVMLAKATSLGILANPFKLVPVIKAVARTLKTDSRFSLNLAFGFSKRVNPGKEGSPNPFVDFRIVPSHSAYIGGVSYVIGDIGQPKKLFDAIRADTWPLPDIPNSKTVASIPRPGDVKVRVFNAGAGNAAAKALQDRLRTLGFDVLTIVKLAKPQPKTVLYFQPGNDLKAKLIDDELPRSTVQEAGNIDKTADVTIYLGADNAGQTASPSPG